MSRTREARRLAGLLSQRAGVAVSVTWDQAPGRGYAWCWGVEWCDGPTVDQVRTWCDEVDADVAPLNVHKLWLSRRISTRAWALHLLRHVAAGGDFANRYGTRCAIEDVMQAEASPDQPADEQEAARADALLRLARHTVKVHGGPVLTGPNDEAPMIDVLIAHGLAALDGEGTLPEGVVPLRRPKRAQEGL